MCRSGLTAYDAAYAFGEYDGTLRKLIHLFKYSGMEPLASRLGALMNQALPREQRFDVIVPMPLHWRRRFDRGFNQSELLADVIAKRTGLRVVNAMRRLRATPAQAGLTHGERRRNVAGVFEVRPSKAASIIGKHVLLIDDVLTTGATASAGAAALKRARAGRVTVLALARVDRRKGVVNSL